MADQHDGSTGRKLGQPPLSQPNTRVAPVLHVRIGLVVQHGLIRAHDAGLVRERERFRLGGRAIRAE